MWYGRAVACAPYGVSILARRNASVQQPRPGLHQAGRGLTSLYGLYAPKRAFCQPLSADVFKSKILYAE
jgi:hypothetical protein